MKLMLSIIFLATLAISERSCISKKKRIAPSTSKKGYYKGKLEVKAACMNYTISVEGNDIDTSLVERSWTDESSKKIYKNVFALASRCDFPSSIQQGDSFYFVIDSAAKKDCAVCMIYYPVPRRHLNIRVIDEPGK